MGNSRICSAFSTVPASASWRSRCFVGAPPQSPRLFFFLSFAPLGDYRRAFPPKASARLHPASSQVGESGVGGLSAIAPAFVQIGGGGACFSSCFLKNDQPVKSLPDGVRRPRPRSRHNGSGRRGLAFTPGRRRSTGDHALSPAHPWGRLCYRPSF
jgi:hypothetical protein